MSSSPHKEEISMSQSAAMMEPVLSPHSVERNVRRELMSQPEFRFSSLVVRRIDNGVCLQGVLETTESGPDVISLARKVEGVNRVINRLLVTHARTLPPKG
jgi:osmotically-inducible protein OsmY